MIGKRSDIRANIRPAKQLWLPLHVKGELFASKAESVFPVVNMQLMEEVVERGNLTTALKNVIRNGGSPGVDGMAVEELTPYLKREWPKIRGQLLSGEYIPKPVRRVEIPKPGGGIRQLGVPTVLDRFIQQALLQVLQREWDATFSEFSYGFRPGRSAHQAVRKAQEYLKQGYTWVVDMDLEKFFDRVNHDKLMGEVRKRVADERVNKLILSFLKSGVKDRAKESATVEGTPQGGPLSPILSNLILDLLDRELERRGHRFVRYADDSNIYVKSERAGRRILKSVSCFLRDHLKLKVNEAKSAVGRPWERQFLGFTLSSRQNRRISDKAIKRFKDKVREVTRRTRGRRIEVIVKDLRQFMLGWQAYFNITEVRSILKELDSWVKRKLRCYLWKQWGRGIPRTDQAGSQQGSCVEYGKIRPWAMAFEPESGACFCINGQVFWQLGFAKIAC